MNSAVENKIIVNLLQIVEEVPRYEAIISRMTFYEDNSAKTPTLKVDIPRFKLWYNTKFFNSLSKEQQKAVIRHEVEHIVRGHYTRAVDYNQFLDGKLRPIRANIAMDLEINSHIQNLPKSVCFPDKFGFKSGLMFEEYYRLLQKMTDEAVDKLKCEMSDDVDFTTDKDGEPKDPSDYFSVSIEERLAMEELQAEMELYDRQHPGSSTGDQYGTGKLRLTKPINIHRYVKAKYSNLAAKLSYGFDEVNYSRFKSTTIPRVLEHATNDFTPSFKVAFNLDTSGSRTDENIIKSLNSVLTTLTELNDEITADLFIVDTEVKSAIPLRSPKDVPSKFGGRGGTFMAATYAKYKKKYDLVITLTDGYLSHQAEYEATPEAYRKKTVLGIDKECFEETTQYPFPVFLF